MKKKEKTYVIIFDKHKNFKEICMLSESSDPFVVNPKSVGDSVYIYTQKEFAKLIESAMRHLTSPVGEADDNDIFANMGQQVILPDGRICHIKEFKDSCTKYIKMGSAMSTKAASADATKAIKKTPEECKYDGSAEAKAMRAAPTTILGGQVTLANENGFTLDGNVGCIKGLCSNTGIHIDGPKLMVGDDLTDVAHKKNQKKK